MRWQDRLCRFMGDERGAASSLLLSLGVVLIAAVFEGYLLIAAQAAQQTRQVEDEMRATAQFVAASISTELQGTGMVQSYAWTQTTATGSQLMRRPVGGGGWGDAPGAVGAVYVPSVSLDAVDIVAPGQAVPGTVGLVARTQGVAITYTIHESLLGGALSESLQRTAWAFAGNE